MTYSNSSPDLSEMKLIVILVIAVAAYALPVEFDDGSNMTWEEFKTRYNKKYSSEEEELSRMEIFESNKQYVKVHNQNKDKHGFELAINEFCDLVSGVECGAAWGVYCVYCMNMSIL